MKMSKLGVLLILAVLGQTAGPAIAQTRTWTGGIGSGWELPTNWSPYGVPLLDETVTIGTSSVPNPSVLIDDDNNPVIANLNLNRNTVLQTIRSGSFSGGIGKLTVNGATTLNDQAMLELKLDTDSLVLNDQSQYEIKRWADIGDFVQVGSDAELTFDPSSVSPTLWLHGSDTVLNNNGTIRAQSAANYIEATNNGLLDLDGSTGNGRIVVEDGKTLQIKGELADDFNGTLEFSAGSPTSTALSTLHMHDDWAIGNGGQVLFGVNGENRIRGGALSAFGTLFDVQSPGWIEVPVTIENSTITGASSLALTLEQEASFRGNMTLDSIVEVLGNGDISDSGNFYIDRALRFMNPSTINDSTLNMRGNLEMAGGSILNSNLAVTDDPMATGVLAFTGPLTIGDQSDITVHHITDVGTHSQLTINHANVAAKTWQAPNLNLVAGTARVIDAGSIDLSGGLSFGSSDLPKLNIESGSTATIGPTGNGDLTMGFLAGESAELVVQGVGGADENSPNRQSELNAGNARIGNRGQGFFMARNGGRANFTGNVKVGEHQGALGLLAADGAVDDGSEIFQSIISIGDAASNLVADLEVGNAGDGYVNVINGGKLDVNGDAYFGRNAGGSAGLTVATAELGRESFFNVDGDIHLGGQGGATADLFDGGVLIANSLQVKSGGLFQQSGGIMALQLLDITDGPATITAGQTYLQDFSRTGAGTFNHAGGEVFIQGGTAEFNSTYAYGGPDPINQPRLNIESGTDATVTYGFRVGDQAGDYAQARVAGATPSGRSTLRGTGGGAGADLHVGRYGSGGLSIEDGGYVKILDDTLIASEAGSSGTLGVLGTTEVAPGVFERAELDVTGRGAQSSLEIGRGGYGILSLGNGGLVRVAGNATVGNLAGSQGELHVFGEENGLPAELDIAGTLRLGSSGEAAMYLYDGGVVKASSLNMGSNGTLNMSGGLLSLTTLNATNGVTNFTGGEVDIDEIVGDVDFSNVTVLPGDSPGVMEIYGNASFDSSTILEIEIGGLRSGSEHDHLFVSEQLTLDGTLDIQLYDLGTGQFAPQAGDEFTILASDALIVGEFDAIGGDTLPGGLGWEVLYLPAEQPEQVVLRAVDLFDPADYDHDGDVDGRDLALWERSYAVGRTSGSDFLAWQRQYNGNAKSKSALAATAVPEPAGLVLMLLGLVGILNVERQR